MKKSTHTQYKWGHQSPGFFFFPNISHLHLVESTDAEQVCFLYKENKKYKQELDSQPLSVIHCDGGYVDPTLLLLCKGQVSRLKSGMKNFLNYSIYLLIFQCWGMGPRASHMLSKCSITELYPQPGNRLLRSKHWCALGTRSWVKELSLYLHFPHLQNAIAALTCLVLWPVGK
jgi:hypothetical protein